MDSAKIGEFHVWFDNLQEYRGLRREVFDNNTYYFETENPNPVIIDAGAHIGLSTLYFKKLYPGAIVMAIEPNPRSLQLLKMNVEINRLENVQIVPVALVGGQSDAEEKVEYFQDKSEDKWYSTGGLLDKAWNRTQESEAIMVKAKRLDELVDWPVDLLKMDIEGVEQEVLMSSPRTLKLVKRLIVEYHPVERNTLVELAEFLKECGYEVVVYKNGEEVRIEWARGLVMIEAVKR